MPDYQTVMTKNMHSESSIKQVSTEDMDLSDERFRISSDRPLAESRNGSGNTTPFLADSIKSIGMINPPVLGKIRDRYIIISGFKRIRAGILAGMTEIRAVVMEPEDRCLFSRIAITDNAFQRQLNIVEQARGVRLLTEFMTARQIAEESSMIFNLKLNQASVRMLCDIACMDRAVHELVENDRLSVNSALKFRQYNYDADIISSFVRLFSGIRTSFGKQKEIITNVHEIAAREKVSVIDVIESDEIRNIIGYRDSRDVRNVQDRSNPEEDENRRGNLVRSVLFRRRFPNLCKAREDFAASLKLVNPGKDIKIEPPADFEGKDYTVSFRFSEAGELSARVNSLSAMAENPLFEKIICSAGDRG